MQDLCRYLPTYNFHNETRNFLIEYFHHQRKSKFFKSISIMIPVYNEMQSSEAEKFSSEMQGKILANANWDGSSIIKLYDLWIACSAMMKEKIARGDDLRALARPTLFAAHERTYMHLLCWPHGRYARKLWRIKMQQLLNCITLYLFAPSCY